MRLEFSDPPLALAKLDSPPSMAPLIDPFGRNISYIRISVTDRCDFGFVAKFGCRLSEGGAEVWIKQPFGTDRQ
jgi:hypothetical protein